MEQEDTNDETILTTEQEERMLKNPDEEAPKVAMEVFPDNKEKQDEFIEDFYKVIMVVGGGACSDLITEIENISVNQVERIAENPKEESKKIAQELYPNDKEAQENFIEYTLNKFSKSKK